MEVGVLLFGGCLTFYHARVNRFGGGRGGGVV